MAIMNPSKLRDVLDLLPYCNLSDTKKKAVEAIITKYLNGEIVPVVHGRWKPDLHPYDEQPYRDEWYGHIFKCSVCGGTTMGDYDLVCHKEYCPNCGAKMDGEADA